MNNGKIAIKISKLIAKFLVLLPGIIIKRKKAVKIFKNELIDMGIDDSIAKELSIIYKNSLDYKEFVGNR